MWVSVVLVALVTISLLPSATSNHPDIWDLTNGRRVERKLDLYGREVDMHDLFGHNEDHRIMLVVDRNHPGAVGRNEKLEDILKTINDYPELEIPAQYKDLNRPVVDRVQSTADLSLRTGGLDYVENDYTDNGLNRWTDIPGKDTPSAIAHEVLTTDRKFVVIMGEPGSGKTVALTKILNTLRASEKVTWTLMIDLKTAIPQPVPPNWEPRTIVHEALRGKNLDLFQKLLKWKPSRINILLDNFHRIPGSSLKKKIFASLENLNKDGVGIILTTTPSIADSIPIPSKEEIMSNKYNSRAFVQIGQLKQGSLDQFIERYLQQKLSSVNNYNSEYAASISKAVGDMYFHKSFENVKQLLDMVITGDKSVFVKDGLVSLQDYLKTETATAKDYGEMLSAAEVNKVKLYEKFVSRAAPSDAAVEHIGLEAWKRFRLGGLHDLGLRYENRLPKTPVSPRLRYTGIGKEFGFLAHDQRKNMFVHEHYDHYFGAKAILDKVKANSNPHIKEIIEDLRDSQNFKPIEFIEQTIAADGPSSYKDLFKEIFNHADAAKILNNLLDSKSDTMAAEIFKRVQPKQLQSYLRSDVSHEFQNTYRIKKFNIQDILFENGMVKSVKMIDEVLNRKEVDRSKVWNFEKFKEYIDNVVSKSRPSLSELKAILETAPSSLKTESFLNEYVHKLVVNGGLRNRLLINALVYEGAVPPNINVNGESPLNVALKTRDLPLVKYLVEELKIPITSKPKMTHWLVSALDSNFMPQYSMPDFWKMMKYVIEKAQVIDLPTLSNIRFTDFLSSLDKNSMWYKLVTGNADQKSVDGIIAKVKENPNVIDGFPLQLKEFRRRYVLTRGMKVLGSFRNNLSPRTLTEMLLKYRGLNELSPTEMQAYQDTIKLALKRDLENSEKSGNEKTLSQKQLNYIQDNLVQNIGTKADYDFAHSFIDINMKKAGISDNQCEKMINAVNEGWKKIQNPLDLPIKSQKISVRDGIIESIRADYYLRQTQMGFMSAEASAGSSAGSSSFKPGGSAGGCDFLFK